MMVEIVVVYTLIQKTVLIVNAKYVTTLVGLEMDFVMMPPIHQVGRNKDIS